MILFVLGVTAAGRGFQSNAYGAPVKDEGAFDGNSFEASSAVNIGGIPLR